MMASIQPSSQCVCPPNSDSALSTSANILSILTFAYVFILSASYTLTIRWDANHDLTKLLDEIVTTHHRCKAIIAKKQELGMPQNILSSYNKAEQKCGPLKTEIEEWISTNKQSGARWYLVMRYVQSLSKRRRWRRRHEDIKMLSRSSNTDM
jgi:hypothetical protein